MPNESSPRPNFNVQSIDHVALVTTDAAASKRWYCDMFGFDALDGGQNPDSPYIGNETTKLAILQHPDPANFLKAVNQGSRACHFAFSTDRTTYESYQAFLGDKGIEYEKLIHADCESIYFSDPDGYLVEVTTYELT